MSLKHVGRVSKSKKKVAIAYRVVPNDHESCIIVPTESLMAEEHDSLMNLIESHTAQSANELADAMVRWTLPDGSNMLHTFHRTGKLMKMKQSDIEVTPDSYSSINLRELVEMIAQQKGCKVSDLAARDDDKPVDQQRGNETAQTVEEQVAEHVNEPLSDSDLARQYRAQAAAMTKEAKRLREQAEELSPTKRKTNKKKASEQSTEQATEGNN